MNESFKEAVASELRSLRSRYNYKQKDVAQKANIDIMTVTRYENNSSSMQLDMIEKIISIYGLNLFIFFNMVNANKHKKEAETN